MHPSQVPYFACLHHAVTLPACPAGSWLPCGKAPTSVSSVFPWEQTVHLCCLVTVHEPGQCGRSSTGCDKHSAGGPSAGHGELGPGNEDVHMVINWQTNAVGSSLVLSTGGTAADVAVNTPTQLFRTMFSIKHLSGYGYIYHSPLKESEALLQQFYALIFSQHLLSLLSLPLPVTFLGGIRAICPWRVTLLLGNGKQGRWCLTCKQECNFKTQ